MSLSIMISRLIYTVLSSGRVLKMYVAFLFVCMYISSQLTAELAVGIFLCVVGRREPNIWLTAFTPATFLSGETFCVDSPQTPGFRVLQGDRFLSSSQLV